MSALDVFWMQLEAERFAHRCLRLYYWSQGELQWAVNGVLTEGEWFFWN